MKAGAVTMKASATLGRWFDTEAAAAPTTANRVDWLRCLPFIGIHMLCLGAWWTGVSAAALIVVPAHVLDRNRVDDNARAGRS